MQGAKWESGKRKAESGETGPFFHEGGEWGIGPSPGRTTNDPDICGARESGGQPHAVQALREVLRRLVNAPASGLRVL